MRLQNLKATLKAAVQVASLVLFGAAATFGQQVINITAAPTTVTQQDGSVVPMWGYFCGAAAGGTTTATCAALNSASTATTPATWSPIVITVPAVPGTGASLTINLTNHLAFTPATPAGAAVNNIPTSLTIVGQVGGGLGGGGSTTPSPLHENQPVTWSTVDAAGGIFSPPPQPARVQSFGTEVAGGATTALSWAHLKPGTYLIESGTHPSIQGPMGLYGILVVTTAPTSPTSAGTAYPVNGTNTGAVTYNADIPVIFSEIDPIQNAAVNTAVNTNGFSESATFGPFLGVSVASLKLTNPGAGYQGMGSCSTATLTCTLGVTLSGGGGSGATATATVDNDPTSGTYGQVIGLNLGASGSSYTTNPSVSFGSNSSATAVSALNLQAQATPKCQTTTAGVTAAACYPPAVNYTPLYYMINGVAFNKTNPAGSLFAALPGTSTTPVTGNVLVRMVNAGLRMHVPSIVGSLTAGSNGAAATAVTGFSLIAEDGTPLPGLPRVQSDVFMAAGKVYDVMINVPTAGSAALPIYDRELSLSGNAINRDSGMLAYISVNGSALPVAAGTGVFAAAAAVPDMYMDVVAGHTLTVSDPSKGVLANDTNVFGAKVVGTVPAGLTLHTDGTFVYTAGVATTFTYCGNGTTTGPACALVTLGLSNIADASGVSCPSSSFTSATATFLAIKTPGVLAGCTDGAGLPITVDTTTVAAGSGMTVVPDVNGGFAATASATGTHTFTFKAVNSAGLHSGTVTASVTFPAGSGLTVHVVDGYDKKTLITDYRWVIEEDRTFNIKNNCTATLALGSTLPPGCVATDYVNNGTALIPLTFGVNFHTSYMPFVAQGCTGALSCESGQTLLGTAAVCDVGDGACRTTGTQFATVDPSQVVLDPTKRYYISVLPGDAANPFLAGYAGPVDCTTAGHCGHGMGGAPVISNGTTFPVVTILSQPSPFPPGKLSVFVFEDDFPLNGEVDSGGGVDVLAPNEPGLGGFQIHLWDAMGGNGDFTGQMTYDMFNQPLTNSLDGTIDPATGNNACPLTQGGDGITGMIVTCPKYESDGTTLSPLAGQALVANLMAGRWGAIATPGADRIARGEEWHQTNTLDGQKAHDVFTRIGEPSYFQEFGPASYHVTIGFANPQIINARLNGVCNGSDPNGPNPGVALKCDATLTGKVTGERLSRTPDERLYDSGTRDAYYWTQCYASVGDPDGEDFAFAKCDADGNFSLSGLPEGSWRITTFDQWNDQLVDGLSTPVALKSGANSIGNIAATQWQTNLYTKTYVDDSKTGACPAPDCSPSSPGIPFANVAVRLRDGSLENLLVTDFTGTANFNETFPLFSWYTVETDVTRYKNTGTHVVYDAGGPADGSSSCGVAGYPPCGTSTIAKNLANTAEQVSVPTNLRIPGAIYCAGADCTGKNIEAPVSDPPSVCSTTTANPPVTTCSTQLSTGRIDPPWVGVEGWQGFPGQNNFMQFGKAPYYEGENGGIKGHVIYASTRPFDDPQMLVQTQWEPLVPHVTINLYQEGFAGDGVTPTLTLVDHTQTSSWDDFAQGFRSDNGLPNMSCPGQTPNDLFLFTLLNQPDYLDLYNNIHSGSTLHNLPNNSQFKCYDGMHNWNQIQPVPYDGAYQFPSVTATNPTTGAPTATNCTICVADPVPTTGADADPLRHGLPMLPVGKYVVEVVLPPGYELVKEEDKNILIGDNYIAPVTQEFGGLGNVFILPDQASVASAYNPSAGQGNAYNGYNAQNSTQTLGAAPNNSIVPAFIPEPTWPCVGESRIVPDYISLYPQSHQVAPFAGATRNLCDRKEVTLGDQMGAIAKFYVYTSTHIASKFTGGITDDFTSEFDPFSPQFGEKFAPPNMPISIKDWAGNEISRVYSDQWGAYNGMTYSTWEVNPPNPTGYAPTVMIFCMNDPGNGPTPDPLFNPAYSQFCYELPFMPGTTQYLDTPVVPTSAFSEGYNHPDCNYPALSPAISEVDGDGVGPWVAAATGHHITITALGDQQVINYGYSGPNATTVPFNEKTVTRHYGFGTTKGTVTIGNQTVSGSNITTWNDTTIVLNVPSGVSNCAVQQQAQYGGSTAQCGQVVVNSANGLSSVDAVTLTIGGSKPKYVAAGTTIQSAIDAANPGDLIMIPKGVYNELLIMWKPVRLQGVGATSSVINANTHPAGKLDPWRAQISCLFGLATNGQPYSAANPFDPTSTFSCPGATWTHFTNNTNDPQIDRLPLEGLLGWDTTVNGNLAQLLQEPTLMGAYEGAGITVLSKGVRVPANSGSSYYGSGAEAAFPTGTLNLTNSTADCGKGSVGGPGYVANPYPSSFWCNPSAIDGLSITDSSQGGGGIFVHAWGHNLQITNNRVYNNIGTLSGGINIGQGESPDIYSAGTVSDTDPGSCNIGPGGSSLANAPTGTELPYCFDMYVNVSHNLVTSNTSIGDELFSGTPAGAGGVSICTGADYYKFNFNWVCGNMSTGDGGGFAHIGFSYYGDIEHNGIFFNQSLNPTIPTEGGGLIVMGAAPDGFNAAGQECGGTVADADCAPGLPDGTGPGLVINANYIMGNAAEAGSGGGLRLQSVNGTEIAAFPNGTICSGGRRPVCPTTVTSQSQTPWNFVQVTNNIISNNVAGWDGGGISLQDALAVNISNNTIISNTSTATAGVLFNTLGAALASAPGVGTAGQTTSPTTSAPQPAGLVTTLNSGNLTSQLASIPNNQFVCPAGFANCRTFSNPQIISDIFWQNASYYIGVGALSNTYQQNVVTLNTAAFTSAGAPVTGTPVASQPQVDATTAHGNGVTITGGTGACLGPNTGGNYWDIGVRGDTGPGNHSSTHMLAPSYSILTNTTEVASGTNDFAGQNPNVAIQYCNGSRTPPEFGGNANWSVPPGISDATVPNPIFNLTPAATVDEGNNWINLQWGPLSLTNPVSGSYLANYSLTSGSPAIDRVPTSIFHTITDFFGNQRPDSGNTQNFDIGAVEFQGTVTAPTLSVSPTSLAFGNQTVGTTSSAQTLTLSNTGGGNATGVNITVTAPFTRAGGTCTATLNAGATCTITVAFAPTAAGAATGTVTITSIVPVTGSPVSLTGTGVASPGSLSFTAATNGTLSTVLGVRLLTFTIPSPRAAVTSVVTITNSNVGPTQITAETFPALFNPGGFFTSAGTTCSFTTPLAAGGTCTVSIRYATPTTRPTAAHTGALSVANNGTGTTLGQTGLGLSAQ